jgi:hypothetical protein
VAALVGAPSQRDILAMSASEGLFGLLELGSASRMLLVVQKASSPQHLEHLSDPENPHHPLEIIGQHVKTRLGAHAGQRSILDERISVTGLTSWVRWKWTLATAAGAQVLDLTAGSLLDRSPTKSESGVPTINRISYKVADAADIVGLSKYVRCRAGTN